MMVYVLTRHYHYENEDIIAAFGSKEKALERGHKEADGYKMTFKTHDDGIIAQWTGESESLNLYEQEVIL